MVEHYSHKIQNAIQKELFKANCSIKIVVAWFTNDLLFQPLLLKLVAGVSVEIILNKDGINCSNDNEVDFDKFVKTGGILRWNNTKQLLHDKFCIIDDNVVIYGSYNWTNKAEYNEESIAISKEEEHTTSFYLEKFRILSQKYPIEKLFIHSDCNSKEKKEDIDSPISFYNKEDTIDNNTEDDLFFIDSYGAKYSKNLEILYKGANVKVYHINQSTKEIRNSAFKDMTSLEEVFIPYSVTSIGSYAFYGCTSLRQIEIVHNPYAGHIDEYSNIWKMSVGSSAFSGCTSLKHVSLPIQIIEIGSDAFRDCTSLQQIEIPNLVKIINRNTFQNCTSLKELSYPDSLKITGESIFPEYLPLSSIKIKHMIREREYYMKDRNKIDSIGSRIITLNEKNTEDEFNKEVKVKFSFSNLEDLATRETIYPNIGISPELITLNDGEIITIPESYKIFRKRIEAYHYKRGGMIRLEEKNQNAPYVEYINVITNSGHIVEFYPHVLFCQIAFEVDEFGNRIHENGKIKILRNTGDVSKYIWDMTKRGCNIHSIMDAMKGCQIQYHFLKSIRMWTSYSSNLLRIMSDWTFIGNKRPAEIPNNVEKQGDVFGSKIKDKSLEDIKNRINMIGKDFNV